MKSIKFAGGREYEIIQCYNNGMRYINGETRNCREIVIADDAVTLGELKEILSDPASLETIEIYVKEEYEADGEMVAFEDTELLENYVYTDEIKDNMKGEITFVIGQKTAVEIENRQAKQAIDQLLIAMEV